MTAPSLTTTSCPDENLLILFGEEGALDTDQRRAIDAHLDGCAACTRLVAELAKLAVAPQPAVTLPPRYRVIRQLGEGGMGVVWEAEDRNLRRKVALKLVRHAGGGAASSASDDERTERRARLFREARALAQLRHPNVVSVFDAGEVRDDRGEPELFLALELVAGANARAWRIEKERSADEILGVWRQAAAGVAAVHRAGLVHRDIKPDNVFVAEDGRVLVGDFGLAIDELREATALTLSGAMVGTPLYMSPEQLHGAPATAKSDQFALCASIWEALAGKRPFAGATIAALALAMANRPATPRGAPPRLFEVLARGLEADPAKRYPDVDALIAALDAARTAPSPRKTAIVATSAALLAAAATVAVLVSVPIADARRVSPVTPPTVVARADAPVVTPPAAPELVAEPPAAPAVAAQSPAAAVDAPAPAPRETASPSDKQPPRRRASTTTPPPKPTTTTPAASTSTTDPRLASSQQPRDEQTPDTEPVNWTHTVSRASDRLSFGDGAGCLKLLDSLPPVPSDQGDDAKLTRLRCRMAIGDCVGATADMQAFGKSRGWTAERIQQLVDRADAEYCPVDAAPRSRWPVRAKERLRRAAASDGTCKAILAIMSKRNITLDDPREQLRLEAACLANAKDCTGAKAKYRAMLLHGQTFDAATTSHMEKVVEDTFPKQFKRCAP